MQPLTPGHLAQGVDALDAVSPLVLAVSGGGDSAAMLHLAARSSLRCRIALVATVDHGFRAAARDEALAVSSWCAALDLPHAILKGQGPPPATGLQEAARALRHRLLARCALPLGAAVMLAHTRDDQAETLLMRLARGSGVDGLSAMAARSTRDGLTLLRPLLDTPRARLRDWLCQENLPWFDDPSNEDPHHERVRIRRAMKALGLDIARLARTASMMSLAREALEAQADLVLGAAFDGETLKIEALSAAPREIALRALARALCAAARAAYRPRLTALESLLDWALEGQPPVSRCLHGCVVTRISPGHVSIRVETPRQCREQGQGHG